jgi:hypothetical protein
VRWREPRERQADARTRHAPAPPAPLDAVLSWQRSAGNAAVAARLGRASRVLQRFAGPQAVAVDAKTHGARLLDTNPYRTANYATLYFVDAGAGAPEQAMTLASDVNQQQHSEALLVAWADSIVLPLDLPPVDPLNRRRAVALYTEMAPCPDCDALLQNRLHAQTPVRYTATYMPPTLLSQTLLIERKMPWATPRSPRAFPFAAMGATSTRREPA